MDVGIGNVNVEGRVFKQEGVREIQDLLCGVIAAFRTKELVDAYLIFCERVLVPVFKERDGHSLLEWELVSGDTLRCRFKPMAELALLDVKKIMETPGLTEEIRIKRMLEVLDMAGF